MSDYFSLHLGPPPPTNIFELILQLINDHPILAGIIVVVAAIVVTTFSAINIVAFYQGREITLGPIKIGARPVITSPPSLASVTSPPSDTTPSSNSAESSTNMAAHGAEYVAFTSYHPKEGRVETWHTLLMYTHVPSALAKVRKDANRFHDQIELPKETTSKSSTPIARGMELTIIPSCEGVTFNPESVSFKWMEDFHRADFRFKADETLSGDAAKGSIDIYVGPLIVGTLKFAMLFNEKDEIQSVPDHEEHAKMYGRDDVFISYSRKDTEIARTFKTILESSGFDVFLDVDDIRSGQLWEGELKRRIEHAQIFQIFWSANYDQSKNCRQEWEYALKQNKEVGYIRPVYWHKPFAPPPPAELNKFNFKYVELRIPNVE